MQKKVAVGIIVIIIIVGIIAGLVLVYKPTPPAPAPPPAVTEKGPALDILRITIETSQEVGIGDVGAGKIDAFIWDCSAKIWAGTSPELLANTKVIKTSSGFWSLIFNPVYNTTLDLPIWYIKWKGKWVFNPFAIREVRFAMNWVINRKYIVDTILAGSGAPMYGPVGPSDVAYRYFVDVYKELGLTPEGDFEWANETIQKAIEEYVDDLAALGHTLERVPDPTSPVGWYWYFDGEPVTLRFYIRIEDERKEEGLYIADLIEMLGFKVERVLADRRTCINTVYYGVVDDYVWNIYTEGWLSMTAYKYPEGSIAQMYAAWVGFMPGWGDPSQWNYVNETIDNLTFRANVGGYTTEEEYWNLLKEAVKLGIQESVRIFVCEQWGYMPIYKDVYGYVYDATAGGWTRWFLITMDTPTHEATVAEFSSTGALFMSPWNPMYGFFDVYSEVVWRVIHDYAYFTHPGTGEVIEVRANNTKVTIDYNFDPATGAISGNVPIDADAVFWNETSNEWEPVGEGLKAACKVEYKILLSKWHHGINMTLADVMYAIAMLYEWTSYEGPGDPFFDWVLWLLYRIWGTLDYIKAFKFIEPDTIIVWADQVFPIDKMVTAWMNSWFPTLPLEILAAMEQVVAFKGNVTGTDWEWTPYTVGRENWLDMLSPDFVKDVKAALKYMNETGYIPMYVKGAVSEEEMHKRYTAAIKWIEEKGHMIISNGPFYLEKYDPATFYLELRAFRDPSYPFTAQYWREKLGVKQFQIVSLEMPEIIDISEPTDVKVNVTVQIDGEVAEDIAITFIIRDAAGNIIWESSPENVTYLGNGKYMITIPKDVIASLLPATYYVEIRFEKEGILPLSIFTVFSAVVGE